jgi:GR25 family glycosyltransferase involved in LPS biosynthesis
MNQNVNTIGCWRAHLNVLRRIVRDNVATALIFEDDADWDVSFKRQLVQFARGSRYILNTTHTASAPSPYGDNWDMLWIGHCGTWYHEEDNRRIFVIPNDPTVAPPTHRKNVDQPDMSHWEEGPSGDNQTRIVFHSKGGVCTAAYAISQQGARKALHYVRLSILCFRYLNPRSRFLIAIPHSEV